MAVSLTAKEPPLDQARIVALESQLKMKLPDQYRDFLLAYNVAVPEKNVYKVRNVTTSIASFFGVSENKGDDLRAQNLAVYANRLPRNALAVAYASGGNLICLNASDGGVFFWDHEREAMEDETPTLRNTTRLAPSFSEFLTGLQPLKTEDAPAGAGRVTSVKLKPGFQEKFKKYMK